MAESTKIEFRYRRIRDLDDITDLVAIIFPGNRNQQHVAARILLALKAATTPVPSLRFLEHERGISRRTLERTRAKLARVGLIECVSPLAKRSNGQPGWRLSSRMSGALRLLADKIDAWRNDDRPERREKDERLAELIRPRGLVLSRVCIGHRNIVGDSAVDRSPRWRSRADRRHPAPGLGGDAVR